MKFFVTFFLLLISINSSKAETLNAKIQVENKKVKIIENKSLLFGGFIEFLFDYVNGRYGIWGQEILHRGFDYLSQEENGVAKNWRQWKSDDSVEVSWKLEWGGFNPNGEFYQLITKHDSLGEAGVAQRVLISGEAGNEFYVYLRSDSLIDKAYVKYIDTLTREVLVSKELGVPTSEWKRYEITLPQVEGVYSVDVLISFSGKGELEIDEASLMPQNNEGGIRKEYYDLFKNWAPGIIRYPGGSFADLPQNDWLGGVGSIDKRKSPNVTYRRISQRLDFGTDEFIEFCESLNIEPHLTINLEYGNIDDAMNWLSYCNRPSYTKHGRMRAENGHPEPYGVKYWELGNEQWRFPEWMAHRYLNFYWGMICYESQLKAIINGNIWGDEEEYFNTVMDVVDTNCQVYGWHMCNGNMNKIEGDLNKYMFMVGSSFEQDVSKIHRLLKNNDYLPNMVQACTEWWSHYGTWDDWLLDTNRRGASLESGLFNALQIHLFIKAPESFSFAERTIGMGLIRGGFNPKNGERIFYGTPDYHALKLLRHNTGNMVLNTEINCPRFSDDGYHSAPYDLQWLDVVGSKTNDTLYISVVNRHHSKSIKTELNVPELKDSSQFQVFQIWSESYLDANTPSNPDKITIDSSNINFNGGYEFPPHSLTVFKTLIDVESSVGSNDFAELKCYPNPFDEYLIVKNVYCRQYNVQLRDIFGKVVWEKQGISDSYLKIPASNFASGIYLLFITDKFSPDKKTVKKVVKI